MYSAVLTRIVVQLMTPKFGLQVLLDDLTLNKLKLFHERLKNNNINWSL